MDDNFARGRSAEVFHAGEGKVLKLFFEDYPREYVEKEYRNTKIVSELGCTSMKVYEKVEKDDNQLIEKVFLQTNWVRDGWMDKSEKEVFTECTNQ